MFSHLENSPEDIKIEISEHLSVQDLGKLAQVSKSFYLLMNELVIAKRIKAAKQQKKFDNNFLYFNARIKNLIDRQNRPSSQLKLQIKKVLLQQLYFLSFWLKPCIYSYQKAASSLKGLLEGEKKLQNALRFGGSIVCAVGGGIGGAALGATIGSMIPVVGTITGAVIGGIIGTLYGPTTIAFLTSSVWRHVTARFNKNKLHPYNPSKYRVTPEGIKKIQKYIQAQHINLRLKTPLTSQALEQQTKENMLNIYDAMAKAKALKNKLKSVADLGQYTIIGTEACDMREEINFHIKELRKGNVALAKAYHDNISVYDFLNYACSTRKEWAKFYKIKDYVLFPNSNRNGITLKESQYQADMNAYQNGLKKK
jgi:hypothetical protein